MALAVPPPNDRKRVKVYELRDNDWFDRGTGFCTGQIIDVRRSSPTDTSCGFATRESDRGIRCQLIRVYPPPRSSPSQAADRD